MLPNALTIGVPYETFWHLTPKKLKAFYKAYEIKEKNEDRKMWYMGQYVLSAVSVAVEHNLAGRKAKSEYIKEPFLSKIEVKEQEENTYKESHEEVAVFEMKQRIRALRDQGLPESPV